jgi:hypothetical protein
MNRVDHPLYKAWLGMRNRCTNPRNSSYARYGARGVFVCDRWNADFWHFIADMGERPPGTTLDRIDPAGSYSPGNCRWADAKTQRMNITDAGRKRQKEGARAGMKRRWASVVKTHCRRGHPWVDSNIYVKKNGDRSCLTCRRQDDRERKRRYRILDPKGPVPGGPAA